MAYIIQHRRDTLENWEKVNPVLADAEIGFVLAQGSSMYKIGDGATAWNDLPLFGFGGNFYDNFDGDDLDQSVPSRRAVLERLQEIAQETTQGSENVEGLLDKLSVKQLVQLITPDADTEDFGGVSPDDENSPLKNQIASRWAVLKEFQRVWGNLTSLEESHIKLRDEDVKALKDFANQYGPIVNDNVNTLKEHDDTLKEHTETLDKHSKYIEGYNEENEAGETIHYEGINDRLEGINDRLKGINDRLDDANNSINSINSKHIILSKTEYNDIKGDLLTTYPEGTIIMTYKDEE